MKSKSTLVLMEQLVMVLVFALAAALCIQAFAAADKISQKNAALDRAVLEAQNAAETLKSAGGDMAHATAAAAERLGGRVEQGLWYVLYDGDWNVVSDWDSAAYSLEAQGVPTEFDSLRKAKVWVSSCADAQEEIFSLFVSWQEVTGDA